MRSATSRPRHHHRHETPQTQPGRHDMTTTDTDGHTTTATHTTDMHGHARRPQARHGHVTHAIAQTKERTRAIPHDTQHVNRTNIRANRRSIEHMYQCCTYNKPPGGGVSPRRKKQGRWVSGLKAECDFRGYLEKLGHVATGWNGAVFAVLASGGDELVWHI